MSDIWSPTLELKWQEVNPTPENDSPALVTVYGGSVYVLQQKWVNLDRVSEWRDIPSNRLPSVWKKSNCRKKPSEFCTSINAEIMEQVHTNCINTECEFHKRFSLSEAEQHVIDYINGCLGEIDWHDRCEFSQEMSNALMSLIDKEIVINVIDSQSYMLADAYESIQ